MAIQQTILWSAGAAVISAASMAGGFISAQIVGPEHRMTTLEVKVDDSQRQNDEFRKDIKDYRVTLDAKLDRIESKLDQLSEKDAVRRK